MSDRIRRTAQAKINLALHVTGQRQDGYHLLDSLVAFATIGDQISLDYALGRGEGEHRLTISGPFAEGLDANQDNLVLKAARLMAGSLPAIDIHLVKNLPIASGIGGGSADAAATLLALHQRTGCALPSAAAILGLGADVPVCMVGATTRLQGIGEKVTRLPALPPLFMVLANPGIGVATPAIFKALTQKNNSPLTALPEKGFASCEALINWLLSNRNDLEPVARTLAPEIQLCLSALAGLDGVLLHRMSGSGATCFALFEHEEQARAGAQHLQNDYPSWWVVACALA